MSWLSPIDSSIGSCASVFTSETRDQIINKYVLTYNLGKCIKKGEKNPSISCLNLELEIATEESEKAEEEHKAATEFTERMYKLAAFINSQQKVEDLKKLIVLVDQPSSDESFEQSSINEDPSSDESFEQSSINEDPSQDCRTDPLE